MKELKYPETEFWGMYALSMIMLFIIGLVAFSNNDLLVVMFCIIGLLAVGLSPVIVVDWKVEK